MVTGQFGPRPLCQAIRHAIKPAGNGRLPRVRGRFARQDEKSRLKDIFGVLLIV
jgi:hypothetical protein